MNNNTNEIKMKVCTKCGRELPATQEYFYRKSASKDGLRTECKECHKPNSKKEYIPVGYKRCSNCAQVLPASTDYFYRKKAGKYGFDSRCKECVIEYRNNNKKRYKKYYELYYVENKDRILERNSKWHKRNKNSAISRKQRRRAKKHKLPATLTEKQWNRIKVIFNLECAYCGMSEEEHIEKYNEQLHQEHFIPLSKGGEYSHNNIVPSCRSCNASKHDEDFFEWYPKHESYNKKREKKILEYLGYKDEGIQQLSIL